MATGSNQQAGIYLPAKQTIGNQAVKPMLQGTEPTTGGAHPQQMLPGADGSWNGLSPTNKQPIPSPAPTGNGLLSNIAVTQPKQPDSPQFNHTQSEYKSVNSGNSPTMNVPTNTYTPTTYNPVSGAAGNAPTMNTPQTEFTRNEYQSNGFNGVQTDTEFKYDPRSESLVQNQLTGLLDPENALMKRAVSQSQALAASRGLQSSSLAAGAGTGAMIDRALPIAQQDAQTYGNAEQLGWQQSFNAQMANADREQQAGMFDKQGELQTNLQNNQFGFENTQQNANRQMQAELQQLQYKQSLGLLDAQGAQRMQELNAQQSFQAGENNANRQMQAELQQLQYQQSMGLLDAQGAQRMQELNAQQGFQASMQDLQYRQQMGVLDFQGQQQLQQMERSSQLNQQRDLLMQRFQDMNMDKSFLQQMQLTQQQYQQQDAMFEKQISAQAKLDYQNAVSTGYNSYLEQVSNVYSNPNMTPEQQAAGVAKLGQLFEQQRLQMQAIFGFGAPNTATPTNPTPTPTDDPTPRPGTENPGADGSWTGPTDNNQQEQQRIPGTGGGGLLDELTRPLDDRTPNNQRIDWAIR